MDFITQLPVTKSGYDAIAVFVDRLTKMVHFAPTYTDCSARDVARLFNDTVFKHHGLPSELISDRNKEPEAAGQGAPAHTAPRSAAGESRRQSAPGVYGSQLYYPVAGSGR
jgi:hypothetical protein